MIRAPTPQRTLYLPEGSIWVHIWTGVSHSGGQEVVIAARIGQPPVFYRSDAVFSALFAELAQL